MNERFDVVVAGSGAGGGLIAAELAQRGRRVLCLEAGPHRTAEGLREISGGSPSSELIGENLGFHPARLVFGLFDEPQDAHKVYPITSHCTTHQLDDDGGFVVEVATMQDPIGFATGLTGEEGPLWGEPLIEATRQYRNWTGLLMMATDENNGTVSVGENGAESFTVDFDEVEQKRMTDGLEFGRSVMETAGAKQTLWTSPVSTHVQGTCRMGTDRERSVVNENCESHDVARSPTSSAAGPT